MKSLTNFVISALVASWVLVIAILSVQNATPVSLRFLFLKSIEVPVGVVLAFSAGLGIMGVAIAQPLFSGASTSGDAEAEDDEYFVDD